MAEPVKKMILLVEDDPDHELLTIRALKKSNIVNDVSIARDGEEAINLLFGSNPIRPQVILLDMVSKFCGAFAKVMKRACCPLSCLPRPTRSATSCAATASV